MGIREWIKNWLFPGLQEDGFAVHVESVLVKRDYRNGAQKRMLKVKPGYPDDNVIDNVLANVADQLAYGLFGNGVEFDLADEDGDITEEWLDACWDANKKEVLLHNLALFGEEGGTCYIKIEPDGIVGRDGKTYPRLIIQDPALVTITTLPNDFHYVTQYEVRYGYKDEDGTEHAHKQVMIRQLTDTWVIEDWESGSDGRWALEDSVPWAYNFAPMIHWQNLPAPDSVYGQPDITDNIILLQNKLNEVLSNTAKINRLQAHNQVWGRGFKPGETDMGPDKMIILGGDNAMLAQLENNANVLNSMGLVEFLKEGIFDQSCTIDPAAMRRASGNMTNFHVRIMWANFLAKIHTKQQLYGDGLIELNRRLLALNNVQSDGGAVVWPDILPSNAAEDMQMMQFDLDNKLASLETISKARGYDYAEEQERIKEEASAANQGNANIGAQILRSFSQGQGVQMRPQQKEDQTFPVTMNESENKNGG